MSGPGFPFSIGARIGTGFSGGSVGVSLNPAGNTQGQMFQTIALPNNKLALYTLTVREPDPPNQAVLTYTFPLTPESVTKEFSAMNNVYDVAGDANQFGVQRIADIYGNSPTTFLIRGTTGWQYHSADGFSMTGNESIATIVSVLDQYAKLNKTRIDNNDPTLYSLEFYDYFSNTFWQVVPVGAQRVEQDSQRPLLFYYNFRLAGIKSVDAPLPAEADDPILNLFSISQPQAVSTLSTGLTLTLKGYSANTAGSVGIAL